MSRSFKHTPYSGERKSRFMKRYANHIVRQNKLRDIYPQHSGYKRALDSWDICDYKTVAYSFEQYYANEVRMWRDWRFKYGYPYPKRSDCKKEYAKWFLRK